MTRTQRSRSNAAADMITRAQLKFLSDLAQTGKLSRTAERLGLSLSAASRMLDRLREAFGDPLFTPHARGLTPTLLFVFDNMTERAFFMELREIIPGQDLKEAVCTKSVGNAPAQLISFDEFESKNSGSSDLGEDFYGDSEYDIDELDREGFEGLGDGPMDNPYDDDRY